MGDTFTSTTSQSWFGRLGGSIKGIFVGIILVIASIPFLFWNEGRAVETYKTLVEGAGLVTSVDADRADPANEGKLVHVTGLATTNETLTDPILNLSVSAIRLVRGVQMYQWVERTESVTRDKLGGGTETVTTYKYEKSWSTSLVDSSRFEHPTDHINPATLPLSSDRWQATNVTLGGYRLSASLIASIGGGSNHFLRPDTRLPANLGEGAKVHQGGIYIGTPGAPQVGDVQIRFQVVMPAEVSIIARQVKNSFEPYRAAAGGTIEMLEMGTRSAEAMFADAQSRNTVLTWGLRFFGFVIMMIGFRMIFSILRVVASVVPLFGSIVGVGVSLVSSVLALSLSLVVIATAWIFYRPLLGFSLLAIAAGLAYFILSRVKKADVVIEEPIPEPSDPPQRDEKPASSDW